MVEHHLWSSPVRSEAGGRKKQRISCGVWLREVQVFSEVAAGERQNWMVQEVVLSPCVFNGKGSNLFLGTEGHQRQVIKCRLRTRS